MDKCHRKSIDLIEKMFDQLPGIKRGRVLDVACGRGNLTRDCLANWFDRVDMFDTDRDDIKEAMKLKHTKDNIDRVE